MNKKRKEKGITLIALVLTIILLIILAVVTIRGITGNEGMIAKTEAVVEDYAITQYKEQIEQVVRNTIVKYSAVGEEVGLDEITNSMKEESLWVKNVSLNVDSSITNDDILVTTIEGYVFQVYYDNTYGVTFVEYVGSLKKGNIPNLKASYDNNIITANGSIENGSIERLIVIYRGEAEDITSSRTYKVDKKNTGWYKVKIIADNGNVRYAWKRASTISEKLRSPVINVMPEKSDGENKWYRSQPEVKITAGENPNAKEIHYTLIGTMNETKTVTASSGATIRIEPGTTRVTAWVEDGQGGRSKEVTELIKYDNVRPEITKVEVTTNDSSKPGANGWSRTETEIKIEAKDEIGIIAGYEYEVFDRNNNKIKDKIYVPDINTKIKVETDGEYTIKIVVIDEAGNRSDELNPIGIVNISKDSEPPKVGEPIISGVTDKEFTVSISAGDEGSGIDRYEFYVNGELKGTKDTGVCKITGLTPNTEYEVYVIVYDKAGNSTKSMTTPVITKGEGDGNGDNTGGDGGNSGGDGDNTGGDNTGGSGTGGNEDKDDIILSSADIGKYVDYSPKDGTSYTALEEYTGATGHQKFLPEPDLAWQIWKFDDEYLYLTSSTITSQTLYLEAEFAYFNRC